MRTWVIAIIAAIAMPLASLAATGGNVTYEVGGQRYEGYYVSPGANAPLVLLTILLVLVGGRLLGDLVPIWKLGNEKGTVNLPSAA